MEQRLMLSLFFGVGIYRILRYRSSNTSAGERFFAALFSGKGWIYGKNERKVLKNNPGLADTLFELLFEKFMGCALRSPAQQRCVDRI